MGSKRFSQTLAVGRYIPCCMFPLASNLGSLNCATCDRTLQDLGIQVKDRITKMISIHC